VNINGRGGGSDPSDESIGTGDEAPVLARSFIVRALLEDDPQGARTWHGFVTETGTGERRLWRRSSDIARFIERRLPLPPPLSSGVRLVGTGMAGPMLTDVITKMLTDLKGNRLVAVAALPEPNVTLERVAERQVGLGNHVGAGPAGPVGVRTVRGGRLDARVRFQLWGATAVEVDDSVLTLQSDLLDDRDELRRAGFLKLAAADTTLAERVDSVGGWRKSTSYDVLYEYQYADGGDAESLIVKIPVTMDTEHTGGPASQAQTLTDEMIRWDDEAAPAFIVPGPRTVARLTALVFAPGPTLAGTVTVLRSTGPVPGPVTHLPDLPTFLAATGGDEPAEADADTQLSPNDFFTGLGPSGVLLELGDWNADGTLDQYTGYDLRLGAPIVLPTWHDRLTITYAPPAGPATGLDQTAVVYLRVNAVERQT
jgi:hypothetical protein